MADLIFALDPGVTTGWAILRRRDKFLLGMGDLKIEDVGSAIDLLVRGMHVEGYDLAAVVEEMPVAPGVAGGLATDLAFVRRTIDHWLSDVFEVDVTYVLPGTWKTSRVAQTTTPPATWNGKSLSQHMKDAYLMASYYARKR